MQTECYPEGEQKRALTDSSHALTECRGLLDFTINLKNLLMCHFQRKTLIGGDFHKRNNVLKEKLNFLSKAVLKLVNLHQN